jgi:WD40 repeat protein
MYTLSTTSSYHVSSPADTYIYDLAIVSSGLAAISSDNSLRLFDPTNLDAGPVKEVKNVNADVTCMKVFGGEAGAPGGRGVVVCTAGRDGKVGLWDPRSGTRIGEITSGKFLVLLEGCCWNCVSVCALRNSCTYFVNWT